MLLELTSLNIHLLRESELGEILSAAPKLRKFKWRYYFDGDNMNMEPVLRIIDCEKLIGALSHVQSVLEDFTIRGDATFTYEIGGYDGEDEDDPLTSLRGIKDLLRLTDFHELKKLEAPLVLLLGPNSDKFAKFANVLPKNIQHVIINNDLCHDFKIYWRSESVLAALDRWLADW